MTLLSRFPVLVSYAYARDHIARFECIATHPQVDLLVDSGAFTASNTGKEVTLSEYCAFLDKYKPSKYIMLDVLGDPDATDYNLRWMLNAGYTPMPVHVYGDDARRMDELFDVSDCVALGGLKRINRGAASRSYVKAVMSWAKGRRTHWLGYTNEEMFPLKPYSMDSSSWKAGVRFGNVAMYHSKGWWPVTLNYRNRKDIAKFPGHRRLLKSLGYTMADVNNKEQWRHFATKSTLLIDLPADCYVRYALDVYRRFGILLYLVNTCFNDTEVSALLNAIERNIVCDT